MLGPGDHIVKGTYLREDCNKKQDVAWADRCLPTTSASTCATMALVLRWANVPASAGGMSTAAARSACSACVRSLLSVAVGGSGMKRLWLLLTTEWVCVWPRPQSRPLDSLGIHVPMAQGLCDFQELFTAATRSKLWVRSQTHLA